MRSGSSLLPPSRLPNPSYAALRPLQATQGPAVAISPAPPAPPPAAIPASPRTPEHRSRPALTLATSPGRGPPGRPPTSRAHGLPATLPGRIRSGPSSPSTTPTRSRATRPPDPARSPAPSWHLQAALRSVDRRNPPRYHPRSPRATLLERAPHRVPETPGIGPTAPPPSRPCIVVHSVNHPFFDPDVRLKFARDGLTRVTPSSVATRPVHTGMFWSPAFPPPTSRRSRCRGRLGSSGADPT